VKIEAPNALRFIFQDEIYLLDEDKSSYNTISIPEPAPEIKTPEPVFNYMGGNKKNFLVLVSYAWHEFIADDHLTALESVLGRKGYNREDVAILNIAKNSAEFELISAHFNPKILMILGKDAMPAGLGQPSFNTVEDRGEFKLLHTYSFDEMMSNNENKKAFWEQVKGL